MNQGSVNDYVLRLRNVIQELTHSFERHGIDSRPLARLFDAQKDFALKSLNETQSLHKEIETLKERIKGLEEQP